MPISSHLLERAYQLINANQIQNAELVLDAVVRVDPQNVDAWKTYLQIHQDRSDLEWLKERILRTRELSEIDKDDILTYQYCLIRQLEEVEEGAAIPKTRRVHNITQKNDRLPQGDGSRFELMDVFDYPTIQTEKTTSRKPDQTNTGKSLSAANYAFALMVLFYFAVRLLALGYFSGYVLMALFVIGGIFWLKKSGNQRVVTHAKPIRTFSLETKNSLPVIDEPGMDVKKESTDQAPPHSRHRGKK